MQVYYLTMAFPVPSETFISNDVQALRSLEVDISIHCLRPRRRDFLKLIQERQLVKFKVTHNSCFSSLRGIFKGFLKPKILYDLTMFVFSKTCSNPIQFIKSLLLIPRALDIFFEVCKYRPDIVHLCWGHYPSIVGYLVQRWYPTICLSIFLGAYDLITLHKCTPTIIRKADVIFTHAKVNVNTIFNIGGRNIYVVYRGVNLNSFQLPHPHEKISKRLVAAGRLISQKGFNEVISIFEEVIKTFPNASLTILGDGPELGNLKKLCLEKGLISAVNFKGHVKHESVLEEMTRSEVFILMSRYSGERLPNVIKEAMASKCLCVTTKTPGIEELLVHEKYGYIVSPGDCASAAKYIKKAFYNPQKMKSMIDAAYKHILSNFDVQNNMNQYKKIWQKNINNNKF